MHSSPTRGHGFLELFLSRRRAAMANALMDNDLRGGLLVDVACGVPPLFLLHTHFARKYGFDLRVPSSLPDPVATDALRLLHHDLRTLSPLPLNDQSVSVVTMLAVTEHLPMEALRHVFREAVRVLRPGGMLILTTPAAWTGLILSALAFLRVVSREEIDEHERLYRRSELSTLLVSAGFDPASIRAGTFECGMNLWVSAAMRH